MVWRRRSGPGVQASLWMLPAVVILAATYFYPLIRVLSTSVTDPHPGVWQLSRPAFQQGRAGASSGRPSGFSLTATFIAVVLGYVVAYAMLMGSKRRRALMFACVMVPFWISILVRTFAWILLLRTEGIVKQSADRPAHHR